MITGFDLQSVAQRFNWQVEGELPAVITNVLWDSRVNLSGALYVALKGERFDGHEFCKQAEQAGAGALLVQSKVESTLPQIVVEDSLLALGQLSRAHRDLYQGVLVAMTGSAGKTTTKTILHTIFSSVAPSTATLANYNNEVGVPKTLLALDQTAQYATVEMGAAKQGDIAYLCDFAKPNIGLVTNAAEAHVQGFGSLQGVASGKGEMFSSLENGTAVINRDSDFFDIWRDMAGANRILSFGFDSSADVYATDIHAAATESTFTLVVEGKRYPARLPIPGKHNVKNALAASACALAAGLSVEQIVAALATVVGAPSRLEFKATANGITVIDDSYNANPLAFQKAIDVLSQTTGRKWLAMGDMAELDPEHEQAQHADVGSYAKSGGVDFLCSVGVLSQAASEQFGGTHFESQTALVEYLQQQLQQGDVVLVKGSRSARMDNIVTMLGASAKQQNDKREASC